MLKALFESQLLRNAVFASILASVVCGIIGVLIVEKKLIMMSGGIAHTAYGGVGLGYFLGFTPIIGAIIFSLLAAFGIGLVKRKKSKYQDVFIALMWSLGMSLGVLFIGFMDSYPPSVSTYLFGSILLVTKSDLWIMFTLTIIIVFLFIMLFNDWKSYLFDEEFSKINGQKTNFLMYLLLVLIAMAIVILIKVVGIILVISLLAVPAGTVGLFSKKFSNRIIISIGLGIAYCFIGLYVSYALNISTGAAIIILASLVFFAVYFITGKNKKFKKIVKEENANNKQV